MIYKAKYLPVEGHFHYVGARIREKSTGNIGIIKKVGEGIDETKVEHVKLFLISTDIKIGDRWYLEDGDGVVGSNIATEDDVNSPIMQKNAYKIVGEISPEAISYVKEEDEFDEYHEVTFYLSEYGWSREYPWTDVIEKKKYCAVKGPCGHFH